jgi:hypothetical protein
MGTDQSRARLGISDRGQKGTVILIIRKPGVIQDRKNVGIRFDNANIYQKDLIASRM